MECGPDDKHLYREAHAARRKRLCLLRALKRVLAVGTLVEQLEVFGEALATE